MATHMKALAGRVTVQPSLLRPLPGSVAVALERQATALEKRLPQLDAELGLAYPPIDVLPVFMETPGNVGAIHACLSFKSFAGITRVGVEMFAPSLIALADNQDLLDGTLVHEFLHYVWSTLMIAQWRALGHRDVLDLSAPPNYEALDENYESLDHAAQVPVEGWLTPRLQCLMMRAENVTSDESRLVQESIVDGWVLRDLPSRPLSLRYKFNGRLAIDLGIVKRAQELGLVLTECAIPHR